MMLLHFHGRRRLTYAAVVKPLQLGFNLPVALGDLALIHPVKLQRLGQFEDVLLVIALRLGQ